VIFFTVVGIVCVAFLVLNLAMTKWDHHKLRQQERMVPLEEYSPLRRSQFAPYVPPNRPHSEVSEHLKPHRSWPEADHRHDRDPESPQDPDS
jgi:hypothetical protein